MTQTRPGQHQLAAKQGPPAGTQQLAEAASHFVNAVQLLAEQSASLAQPQPPATQPAPGLHVAVQSVQVGPLPQALAALPGAQVPLAPMMRQQPPLQTVVTPGTPQVVVQECMVTSQARPNGQSCAALQPHTQGPEAAAVSQRSPAIAPVQSTQAPE